MCEYKVNPFIKSKISSSEPIYNSFNNNDIQSFHQSLPGYQPTPLEKLSNLAASLGLGQIYVKDEAHRFGLKAFKSMGASYAVYRFIKQKWEQTFGVLFEFENLFNHERLKQLKLPVFCTATDGNHGRAVAWFANRIGQKAVVYMPGNSVKARIDNIKNENARVVIVDGDYDLAVSRAAEDARQNGWQIISDTSFPGYYDIPAMIMAGYTTIFNEIDQELVFDLIILQGGVGSFAASAVYYYRNNPKYKNTKLVVVEPTVADCLLESIKAPDGGMKKSPGKLDSIMAGLNCGTPSVIAWPLLKEGIDIFLSVSDDYAKRAMKQYFYPVNNDKQIISGESGSAGLAALLALLEDKKLSGAKELLNLTGKSKILLFNTEGDTDPVNFHKIISNQP